MGRKLAARSRTKATAFPTGLLAPGFVNYEAAGFPVGTEAGSLLSATATPTICASSIHWTPAMSELNRITVSPDICGGRPCLRGTRVRVKDVLDMLAAGVSRADILDDYPYLEDGDITAALEYAARQADHTVLRAA
jgi:uncharacterized protein (DUF433 family)